MEVHRDFNRSQSAGTKVSLADLIVLDGCAAVEQAARNAGHDITVPFAPGRTDAPPEQTDAESFAVLEPTADGFRNYLRAGQKLPPETLLVDRAFMLTLDHVWAISDGEADTNTCNGSSELRRESSSMAAKTNSSNTRSSATTARGKKNTRPTASSSTRSKTGPRASSSGKKNTSSSGKKNTSSRARSSGPKVPATPAGKSLDRAQHALDQATKTEKQLRTSLKKHTKQVHAVQADLGQRDHDLKTMKSQLKAAKKSRKQAAKAVQI